MKKSTLILTLALALPASLSLAQRPGGPGGPPPPGMPPGPPPVQQPGNNQRPPRDGNQPRPGQQQQPMPQGPSPLLHVLDMDDDGIISAGEIDNSPESLAKLDKNKDGKLTKDEFAPLPPQDGQQNPGGDRPKTRNTVSDKNLPPQPFPGQRPAGDGQQPKVGPRDGDAPRAAGPRDGDAPRAAGPRDGDAPPAGARNGGDNNQNHPKPPPLIGALDANHDGVISAEEIANAPKSLESLDKNNDGQLGPREYMGRPEQPPKDDEPVTSSSLR
jgi:hypothetical protein